MLNSTSPVYLHILQNAALVLLSLAFLPVSTYVLLCSYVLQLLTFPRHYIRRQLARQNANFRPKTIIVTGVGMTKGLVLARAFHEAGHTVIGADFEPHHVPVCGRFSRALKRFYRLPKPDAVQGATHYIEELTRIASLEKADLWVSCSGVASAVEDGQVKEILERITDCVAIQYDVDTTEMLHEKSSFIAHTQSIGLPVPETFDVTSRSAVHKILDNASKKKKRYIMKSVGVDDSVRGDMTLLPRRTMSQTYSHISKISISSSKPWVLQEFVKGKEYCTHALVVHGEVVAFVACESSELLMHYMALHSDSALSDSMLKFTQEFVSRSGGSWNGHLSFDFLVQQRSTEKGLEQLLFPIECNPRAHTAVALFNGLAKPMSNAYFQATAASEPNGVVDHHHKANVLIPQNPARYYWIGHDLVELVILPLIRLMLMRQSLRSVASHWKTFAEHLLFWKDGTYELWDPLPWWWLYHVYWPGMFAAAILNRQWWSRINVSTTKMFRC